MKTIKFIIAAALLMVLMGSCKPKLCPGYGNMHTEIPQVEQNA